MISDQQVADLMVNSGLLDAETVKASQVTATSKQKSLVDIVLDKNLVKASQLGAAIATIYKCPFVEISREQINEEVLRLLPELVAIKQQAIVFGRDATGLKLAMVDPSNFTVVNLLRKKTGEPISIYFTLPSLLKEALGQYRRSIRDEFEEIIKANLSKVKSAQPEDLSIIKIVDNLIAYAHHNDASDIHIEPQKTTVIIRFRIDGILHDVLNFPLDIHELVVARVKILSRLRIDEHRSAQDGKIAMEIRGEPLDVRVSILPTVHGEKVVMRLLSAANKHFSLEELGLGDKDLVLVKDAANRPHGMILATGPTGSGKSTTLYALVQLINSREINISTIEDPVEYDIPGVNQIQVDPKTNLTFASGLRSLLRQDPDVIMVGEIRDEETASIAVNSAMTGHLVLSTLHTNDAATTLPRLIEMKVEPFLIASTVHIIIAQRLVRRVCPHCIASYNLSAAQKQELLGYPQIKPELPTDPNVEIRLYRGNGCNQCGHTGFKGRIGLFEVMLIDDTIREMIMKRTNADEIKNAALQRGMVTMLQDGWHKAVAGKTTIEEVLRATSE
ncbi:MAG: GspE/PulE family protein [Candidatus Komeilibacteria bacterium]